MSIESEAWKHVLQCRQQNRYVLSLFKKKKVFVTYLTQNGPLQVQPGLAVPQRGESVDDTSAWHGARAQNEHVGARHLLLL